MYMYIGAVVTNHNGTKCLAVNTSTHSLITIAHHYGVCNAELDTHIHVTYMYIKNSIYMYMIFVEQFMKVIESSMLHYIEVMRIIAQ